MVEKWLKKWLMVGAQAKKQRFSSILELFLAQNTIFGAILAENEREMSNFS